MNSNAQTPLLQLDYRSDLDILVGRWSYQPQPHELPLVYQQLEADALHTQCRFWLQDIRRRTLNDPQTTVWLFKTFFPDMARHLGGRLHVAYLVSPALQQTITSQLSYMPAEDDPTSPFATAFFGDEGAAIRWLQQKQPSTPAI